jgi:phosphoesterase RecJ-like protein
MIGTSFEIFQRANSSLEIDHHRSRTPFADVSLVDADASSAGELVYELLREFDIPITEEIAQNILTSLIVETNSFRLPGIRSRTFELCAELLKTGVDFYKLAEKVYRVTSKETALLWGICMSRCRFSHNGEIAWATITRADINRIGASEADLDPVAEKIRSIQGVKIAVLFREKPNNHLRVSLRSKEAINLAPLAEQFGGGGHISAAGCTISNKRKNVALFLKATSDLLDNHVTKKIAESQQTNKQEQARSKDNSMLSEIFVCETMTNGNLHPESWIEETGAITLYNNGLNRKLAS